MLREKINSDLKSALKSGNSFEAGVLRFLNASLHNKEIEKRGKGLQPELSDVEIIEVLQKEAKKRKEAAELYIKGGRNDLAQQETQELNIIQKYLPEQLSEEEIEKVVKIVIEKTGAKDIKDFGRTMGGVMKELSAEGGSASGGKGKADAKTVSEIIRRQLSE